MTLCLFLSQVIDPDHSCRASVARLIAWRVFRGLPPCDEDTGTYCDARKRLPTAVVRRLVHETARRGEAEAPDSWLWKGRRVYLVDGTTVSMPDTPANQAAFPQPRTQKARPGVPDRPAGGPDRALDGPGPRPGHGSLQGEGDRRDGAVPEDARRAEARAMWWSGTAVSARISCWRSYRGGASMGRSGCTRRGSATSVAGGSWGGATTSWDGPSQHGRIG